MVANVSPRPTPARLIASASNPVFSLFNITSWAGMVWISVGLGGQIVLDLAPCPKKDRPQVEQAFRTAFRPDPIETSLAGWTPLGHLELNRKRERLPLSEALK